MTTGGPDGRSETTTRPAEAEPAADWDDEETAWRSTERELRYQLATHLRDRRRVLTDDGAPPAVVSAALTTTTYPALPIRRPLAVTVYLAQDQGHQVVEDALADLLTAFDLEVVENLPPLRGSWYRDVVASSRRALTSRELGERLRKVERGIELQLLHKQQAEIDSMQGDAVAKLLTALEHTPDALVQIGSVLLVKVDGVPAVRNLTQLELRHLEHNPRLLTSPATILDALQAVEQRAADLVDQDS